MSIEFTHKEWRDGDELVLLTTATKGQQVHTLTSRAMATLVEVNGKRASNPRGLTQEARDNVERQVWDAMRERNEAFLTHKMTGFKLSGSWFAAIGCAGGCASAIANDNWAAAAWAGIAALTWIMMATHER